MIRRDYHNFTLQDAIRDVELVISGVRQRRVTEDAEFIVGHGVIRNQLMALLNDYDLWATIQVGNSGVITCTIE